MHKKPPHPPVVPPRRAQLHREVKTPLPLLNTKTKPAKPSSILPGIVLVFLFCLIGVFFYESHQATLLATQSRQELKLLRQESNLRIRARQAAANGSVKVQPPRVEPEPTVGGGDKESVDPVAEAELRPRGSIEAVFQTKDSFPVSGVEVEFVFANTIKGGKPAPRYKAITDSEGIVRFSEVVAGTYTVKSDRQNYKPRHGKEHSVQEGIAGKRSVFEMVSNLKYGGIVQDIRKRPMVGAEVELLALSHVLESSTGTSIRSERSYRKTKASGKGSFELPEVYEGLNLLRVTYPGYVPHSSEFTLLSSRTNELIILEPASVLGGLVRSTEGLPLGGATLQLTSEKNAKFTQEVGTLPNGRFLFNSIPDSHTFTLEVSLKGYLPEKLTDVPSGRENLVIELEAGGSISGTVRNFSTQAPESGIAILLIPSVGKSEFTERRTVSDSSGRYEFTELPAGQYDVRVQSEKLTATPHLGVTVASGKRTDKIDFSVYPGQEIRGLVLDEATGERIVAATVSLQSSVGPQFLEKGSAEARTDESGQFVFQNLPYGLYTLSATAEGYRQIPGPEGTAEVHLLENQSQEPVELLLRRGGSIEGQVLGHNNAPVPKASVQVINAPDAQYRLPDDVLRKLTVQTDSGGSFLIQGIPVDSRLDLILTATATGYAKGKSEPLILTEFLPTTVANVFLKSGTPLLVRVEGEHGFGLGDAEVRFVSAEFHGDPEPAGWSTKTGAMGEVTLMDLPAGVGRVHVSKKGYLSDSREVALPADDRIDFVLAKSNTIVGRVVDDAGVPFSEGWVQASAEQGSFGGGRATIQQNGFFTIEGIGSGTFTLEAEGVRATPIGKNAVRRILRRVRSGETQATITIPLRGRVQGQILESSTLNTIPNSTASLQGKYEVEPGVLRDFRATFSMGENPGEFDFTALPPGEYTLTASAPNFIPEKIEPFRIGSPGWRNLGKILLNSGAQVTGTVVDAQTGQPVSGAIVQLVEYKRTARTNSKGEYRLAALEAGITDVEFTHPDYKKTVLNLVQVRENKKTELGRTKLQPGATLLIRVLDSKRDPVANAKISVREMGVEKARNSSTDASGRSTVRGLEAGSVYISVSKSYRDGTLTKSQEKTVAANDVASVEIILEGGLQLEGQIVPPPNRSILSPFVKLIPIEPDGRPLVRGEIAVPVSNTNQFKVQNLTGGNYLLLTQLRVSNEVARWHQSIKLTDPRTSLTLQPPSGSLQGKVLSQTSLFELAPLEKAHIRLRALSFPQSGYGSLQSWWEWQTLADGTGAFRIPYLRGGEYELVVTPQGSENPWVDIITLQTGQQKDIDVLIPASQLKAPGTFAPFWFEE